MRQKFLSASKPSNNANAAANQPSGLHYWNVQDDLVFADAAAAKLFGFSESEGERGMPIECYLSRIHGDDLPRVAKAIHQAMIACTPYHEEYRIVFGREAIGVVAIGHWFRDANGRPRHYAGMLFKQTVSETAGPSIEQLCLAAHDMALEKGHLKAAERIVDALACLAADEADI